MATTELPGSAAPEAHDEPRRGLVDWLCTVDHKRIGILYILTAFAIFLIGGIFSLIRANSMKYIFTCMPID